MNDKENLFKEFPKITEAEWIEKVEKDLKGKALEDLFWKINDDIKIAPFYHSIDKTPLIPNNKQKSNSWEIGEDICADDPKIANMQLLHALENGVNAPRFILENSLNEDQFATLFENVELSYISVHFLLKKNHSALATLSAFYNFLLKNDIDPAKIHGSVNHSDKNQSIDLIQFAIEKLPNFKIKALNVEAVDTANIGKSLALVISEGNDYLVLLNENGIAPKNVNDHIQFSVSIGTSYFAEIAKIRALKILWANILEAYGLKKAEIPTIEAHLSPNDFGDDPNTNMIRSTTQAMSVVLGGVNRLTVLPSDSKTGKTTDFSRRIARNVQHLLMMESFMDRVIDPAKGSYYIEKLTEKFAETAWTEFQKIQSN